ncbi:MAG: response regulator [Bacilli bacterium]
MKDIRILHIDDNASIRVMVKEYFQNNKQIKINYSVNDGLEGLKILKDNYENIDLIILDLIMPNKDGISFLDEIKQLNMSKNVIVITSYNQASMIKKIAVHDVDYYMLKPFEFTDLEKRIYECANKNEASYKSIDLKQNNLQVTITKVLHDLGIPSHIKGYQY